MSRHRTSTSGVVALIALAAAGLAPSRADAMVLSKFKSKGAQANVQFGVFESIPCNTGGTPLKETFISILSFETELKIGNTATTQVITTIAINFADLCTNTFTGDFLFVEGGTLPMNALQTATLAGHFVFPNSGTVLDLNLTLTGVGGTDNGMRFTRSNVGPTFFRQRSTSSQRDATMSGTVLVNGQNLPLTNPVEFAAGLSRNTGGEIVVIQR